MDIESQPAVAGDSIKSRTPAEMLGRGPRPGVKRSGTPGLGFKNFSTRGAGDSRCHLGSVAHSGVCREKKVIDSDQRISKLPT
jgi:hypothetical protein